MNRIVVSLTSFPAAINYALSAIRSILKGSRLPDRLVLYLTFDQFKDRGIPEELREIEKNNDIFEIRDFPLDIRSYRKLVPALKDFPDDVIVTVDDDVDYDRDMLKDLLEMHDRFPEAIIANRAKIVDISKPYRKWKKLRWYDFITERIKIDPHIIQTGVGGVLYPPHSLRYDMIDESLFMQYAPTTDDIWFWAAAVSNGKTVIPMPFGRHNKPKEVGKPRELSLKTVNFKDGTSRNDDALKAILDHYPEIESLLKN
ncbi:MAG: glycosyltransferase [Muribaculaceae bacterium]|nr:glycosyltransferase [Muribaculaceae bacterium]